MEIKDCYWPWYEAFIHTNGDVKPCCYAPTPVGNLYIDGDLQAIWQGEVMNEVREAVDANRLHRVCMGAPCIFVRSASAKSGYTEKPLNERLKILARSGSGWGAARYGTWLLGQGQRDEGETYLKLGVERRDPGACLALARLRLSEADFTAVQDEVLSLLRQASQMQDVEAMLLLSRLLAVEVADLDSRQEARGLLNQVVARGSAEAAFVLAEQLETGHLGAATPAEALHFYRVAAGRRHPGAEAAVERLVQVVAAAGRPR